MAVRAGLLAAVLLLSASACGRDADPAAPPAPAVETPLQEGTVTEDDDGRAVALQPGGEVPLQLSSAWSWGEPRVTGDAVRLDPVDHLVDPGYVEWLVVGVAAGTAEVEVAGEPACADPADCPARVVHLTVEVG